MLSRPLNVGFSGGENKKNEILQMALIEPEFVIMDETDSGLDIDALKIVSNGVNALRNSDRSFNHNSLPTLIKLYQAGLCARFIKR